MWGKITMQWTGWKASPAWLLAIMALLLLAPGASAMRVAPMVLELTTTGSSAVGRIEVGNAGTTALPFETTITQIEMDQDGRLTETPAEGDFVVFPPQSLVPVGGRQVIRVQWTGPELRQSRAYYLAVRQLPVATDPNQQGQGGPSVAVSLLYTMKALVVVAPPNTQPRVEVASARPIMIEPPLTEDGVEPLPQEPGIEVVVTNSGDRYALMSGATWVVEGVDVTGQSFSRTYSGGEISQALGVGYLAPGGGRRVFRLATGAALDPNQRVTVRFTR
ncbi:MAG TPA: fimbria/pilus periplasmic chaperone [Terricaulis sp.]|nr:fimbria/pilus periplasmic chaperone [Terricaulis sp.]